MDFEKTAYIDWIYIDKKYRSKGIGRRLLEESIEYSKEVGANYCYLFTASNDEAQKFYKGLDFLDLEMKEVAHKYFSSEN